MAQISVRRKLGWLLATNRRLGPDPALRCGNGFARAVGGSTSPSSVTRWERGQVAAGRRTIRRYEQLLGLPTGQLTTVSDAMVRLETSTRLRTGVGRLDDVALDTLLEKIGGDAPLHGAEWVQLTEQIESSPGLVLHPRRLWRTIAERLLTELIVAEKGEWLHRSEAMSRLLEHPVARAHAVAACIALVEDDTSPVVVEPLGLLDVVSDDTANRYVFQQLTHPKGERAFQGALRTASRKIRHGHFTESQLRRLAPVVREALHDPPPDPDRLALALDVARLLSGRAPARAALRGMVPPDQPAARWMWTSTRLAEPATARAVSLSLARLTQAQHRSEAAEPDEVLAGVIEEALYSSSPDRRLLHGQLLAATPLREALGNAFLTEATAGLGRRDETFAVTALPAMTVLNVSTHRPLIGRILSGPGFSPTLRHAAARALPHCPGRFPEPVWRTILARQLARSQGVTGRIEADVLRAIVYGIGTDGHTELLAAIRADPALPPDCRSTAHWQLSQARR